MGKSEAYTLGKSPRPTPPVSGVVWPIDTFPEAGGSDSGISSAKSSESFLATRVVHCCIVQFFHPARDIHARAKKTGEVPEIWPFFWQKKPPKKVVFSSFLPLTRPRGPFSAGKGARSCSPTYCDHIDYLVANFGQIFFSKNFRAKKSITSFGSGFGFGGVAELLSL